MGESTDFKTSLETKVEEQIQVTVSEQLSEKYQIFVGQKIHKAIHRVKGRNLVEFAYAIGHLNPKYVNVKQNDGKIDYSRILAHPAYPNCFVIDAAFDITGWKFPPNDGQIEGELLIPIPSKILHVSQSYDYTNAQTAIQDRQKLYSTGYCDEIYVKNNRLWITVHLDTRTEEGLLVVQSKVQFVVREAGFN